jgi:hypothetical protein
MTTPDQVGEKSSWTLSGHDKKAARGGLSAFSDGGD